MNVGNHHGNVVCPLLLVQCADASGATLLGIVIDIGSGDSLVVLEGDQPRSVRLAGVVSPVKSEAWAEQSKRQLSQLVLGKAVTIDWSEVDAKGSVVGRVLYTAPPPASGAMTRPARVDAGMQMIFTGLARYDPSSAGGLSELVRSVYWGAENRARDFCNGLWADRESEEGALCERRKKRFPQNE